MRFGFKKLYDDSGEDRRQYPRYNVVKPGFIYVDNKPVQCLIIDISKKGIRISTSAIHGLTGEFSFDFEEDGAVIRGDAEVVYGMTSFDSEVYGCKLLKIVPSDYIKRYERSSK